MLLKKGAEREMQNLSVCGQLHSGLSKIGLIDLLPRIESQEDGRI